MECCEKHDAYLCGIFVRSTLEEGFVNAVIDNLKYLWESKAALRRDGLMYDNGSFIRIKIANTYERGYRFNYAIIDADIEDDIVKPMILSRLINVFYKNGRMHNIPLRECFCKVDITRNDVEKAKCMRNANDIGISIDEAEVITTKWIELGEKYNIEMELINNEIGFNKEYMCMWDNNTAAYRVKQVGTDKVYIYKAEGIPADEIHYDTEFVNRTKETYLNIKGEYVDDTFDIDNKLDVHLLIDTDVYDSYEVKPYNGLVFVILHEIINEQPVLQDVTVRK